MKSGEVALHQRREADYWTKTPPYSCERKKANPSRILSKAKVAPTNWGVKLTPLPRPEMEELK